MKLNDLEIGYIAGIIDGEGSISLKRQSRRRSLGLFIQVTNSNKAMLKWLQQKIDGGIYPHSSTYSDGSKNRLDAWIWQLRKRDDVKSLLNQLLPVLIIKKRHAELMLEFIEVHWAEGTNPKDTTKYPEDTMKKEIEIFSEMWELNSRGKDKRKFPPLQEKDFGAIRRCKECNNAMSPQKRINSKKPDESLCCTCNKKKFGDYWTKRSNENESVGITRG